MEKTVFTNPLRPGMPGLSLWRPCESCYSLWEFMWAAVLLCLKDTVSLEMSITFDSYHLSTSVSTFIPEPRGINPRGTLLETFHLGLSELIWAWIILCPEDAAPFESSFISTVFLPLLSPRFLRPGGRTLMKSPFRTECSKDCHSLDTVHCGSLCNFISTAKETSLMKTERGIDLRA